MNATTSAGYRFGIDPARYTDLINAVSLHELDGVPLPELEVTERFARATWTYLIEPGDSTAGLVVESLGASAALTAVTERWTAIKLLDALLQRHSTTDTTLHDLASGLERWIPRFSVESILSGLAEASRLRVVLLTPEDPKWPAGLSDLGQHAPLALWVRGEISALDKLTNSVTVAGARASSNYGEHVTMEAVSGLVGRGYTIVAGGAYGIEGMAHRATVASGGITIAVLAGGVDRLYPAAHHDLLLRVASSGAIISELPCGSAPSKWRFLQRSRILAAISRATILVEAGARSGSLSTAAHASSLGRPLGAFPGPVTSSTSTGCHRVIRENGAALITSADDIAELAPIR